MSGGPIRNAVREHWRECARWSLCFTFVVGAHAGGAVALLAHWNSDDLAANPPAIMIDLAPEPAAPEMVETDMAVGPQQVESEPEPEPEKPIEEELKPEPEPEPEPEKVVEPPPPESKVQLEAPPPPPEKPKPKPKPKPKKEKRAKQTTAPAPAPRQADTASAPMSGASGRATIMNWKSLLVSRLERSKRYPSEARSRGDQGVVYLAFSVDRSGRVHGARITRSSGSAALDSETLALASRVSPLPPPPLEVQGNNIPIVVPIRYNIR
ncbi:MAG TPA: energy transducer TonB [Pseudolabrys sp.]|nr:energy transducer TonB [Pseudolabrys sp.]